MNPMIRKVISVLLAAALLGALTGCGAQSENTAAEDTAGAGKASSAAAGTETGIPAEAYADPDRADKTELVYANAGADGSITKVTVDTTLKNPGDGKPIEDYTELTGLKNTEGNEDYTDLGSGKLEWENLGEDIQYEGKTDKSLPVELKVTYYLEGKETAPEDMEGVSGNVTIRFDYTNTTADSETGYVPFMAVTAVLLGDDFYNIKVDNGKVMEISGSTMAVGYAMPGLTAALQLENYEPAKDLDIPESIEITAYTTDFSLEFTATMISNGMFEDLEDDDVSKVTDLYNDLNDISYAASEAVDGIGTLNDGAKSFRTYLAQYISSVNAAASASADTAALSTAIASVEASMSQLGGTIAAMDENDPDKAALQEQYDALAESLSALETSLAALSAGTDTTQLTAAGTQLLSGYDSLAGGIAQLYDGFAAMNSEIQNEVWKIGGQKLKNIEKAIRSVRAADTAYDNFGGLAEGQTGEVSFVIETAGIGD